MRFVHAGVLILAALFVGSALADDEQSDADSAWLDRTLPACAACHGPNGSAPVSPSFPVIAGQRQSYLRHALQAYRAGDRNNIVMGSLVQGMTDTQLAALAQYFSNQSSELRTIPNK